MKRTIFVVLIGIVPAFSAQIVTDEAIRIQALAAVFQKMTISAVPGKKLDQTWRDRIKGVELTFPDALKDEKVYQITGPASQGEQCSAENVIDQVQSNLREIRFRLFELTDGQYLLAMQYNFPQASPAMSCLSIGKITLLSRTGTQWKILSEFEFDTTHHNAINSIQFAHLAGEAEQLIVESDGGGMGAFGSTLFVFDLSNGMLDKWIETDSRDVLMLDDDNLSTQNFDVARTAAQQAKSLCFTETTYAEKDKWFRPPRVTHPCYPRGTGVEPH